MEPNLVSTKLCMAASTSPFDVAFITLTLERQPFSATTLLSVGSLVAPHVATSGAAELTASLMRVSTNLNADALVHEPDVEGKFTFRLMPGGRMGAAALNGVARSAVVSLAPSAA